MKREVIKQRILNGLKPSDLVFVAIVTNTGVEIKDGYVKDVKIGFEMNITVSIDGGTIVHADDEDTDVMDIRPANDDEYHKMVTESFETYLEWLDSSSMDKEEEREYKELKKTIKNRKG